MFNPLYFKISINCSNYLLIITNIPLLRHPIVVPPPVGVGPLRQPLIVAPSVGVNPLRHPLVVAPSVRACGSYFMHMIMLYF